MIRRTLQFSKLDANTVPSDQTAFYLTEASRCYIHGFFLSSVAMSRCALEQALRERLSRFVYPADLDRTLNGLIEVAERNKVVLSAGSIGPARDLARKCNNVMHKRPVQGGEAAFEILVGIRGLIVEMFSAKV